MLLFARENGFLLRYIEYMSNSYVNGAIKGLRSDEILAILKERFEISIVKHPLKRSGGFLTKA